MEGDLAYFRRRASEERAAASRADNLQVKNAHKELARRYEELALSANAASDQEREIIRSSMIRVEESWKLLKRPVFRAFET